jgi:mannose-6-phosphate isomerase-like protein (cupin superfamily)
MRESFIVLIVGACIYGNSRADAQAVHHARRPSWLSGPDDATRLPRTPPHAWTRFKACAIGDRRRIEWHTIPAMLTVILSWALLLGQTPAPASATIITAGEVETTLKQSKEKNVVDTPIKSTPIQGGTSTVAMLYRTQAETSALIHDHVTEIYQVMEGSGTLITGGRLEEPRENDLTRLGAGMSHTGKHVGGESRHVGPKDVIVVPAGMAHRFSQLDGPISYLVYRFAPTQP